MFNFKALLEAWRGEGLVADMYAEFEDMLAKAVWIFNAACKAISGETAPDTLFEDIRARDKEINRLQRLIRRQVVEHLTMRRDADVTVCLILMSIVKDAERLGDYGRDLFKVADICPDAAKTEGFAEAVAKIETHVNAFMEDGRKALAESDETLARNLMAREDALKKECDRMMEDLAKSALPPERIVALTLIAHYLRRLTAHTANIASGVINPVERLDYKPKD